MAAHGWSKRFRFPGYDGALPKALRSVRGRGKYQHKVNKPPSDWGLFELLATVAGQILQEKNLNEDKAQRQAGFAQDRENATEHEDVSQAAALGFVQRPQSGIVGGKATDCSSSKSKDVQDVEITSKAFDKSVNSNIKEGVESGEIPLNPCASVPYVDSTKHYNIVGSSDKGKHTIDDIQRSRVIESRYTVSKETNPELLEPSYLDVLVHSEGHEESDRLVSEEGSCIMSMRHPSLRDESPLLSCGSMEEDLTSVHTQPCEFRGKKASEKPLDNTRQKLVCITAKDDDDNFSVAPTATSPERSSQKLLAKELQQEELHHGSVIMETSTSDSKSKFFQTIAKDASIGSSPPSNMKAAWRGAKSSTRESHDSSAVKVNITSFTVPELSIDLPKTASVANLKRAVMDAAINVLGGGLHVRVLHQGKKVSDENITLVQMGISNCERLDSLTFMLEPVRIADTTMHVEDPHFGLSDASNESTAWYPVFSLSEDMCENKAKTLNGECCECVAMDVSHNLATQGDCSMAIEPGRRVEPHQYIPGDAPLPLCGPLILHSGLKDAKIMDIVMAQQSFHGTNSGKRRVRRPFTIIEVAALVQAVELLGTGRWREVKQQAFDHARHRTYVDLKDKWKTLVHTAHIAPHQRRGEPVPQELLDRVLKAHTYWAAQHAKQQAIPGM